MRVFLSVLTALSNVACGITFNASIAVNGGSSSSSNSTVTPIQNLMAANQISVGTGTITPGGTVTYDPSGNFYFNVAYTGTITVAGTSYSSPSGLTSGLIIKMNSAGTIQWVAEIRPQDLNTRRSFMKYNGGSLYVSQQMGKVAPNSGGTVDIKNPGGAIFSTAVYGNTGGNVERGLFAKLDATTGNWIAAQKIWGGSTGFGTDTQSGNFDFDSSGNIYLSGSFRNIQLQLPQTGGGTLTQNWTVSGSAATGNSNQYWYAKVNATDLSFTWIKSCLTATVGCVAVSGMYVDPTSDNLYSFVGFNTGGGTTNTGFGTYTSSNTMNVALQVNKTNGNPIWFQPLQTTGSVSSSMTHIGASSSSLYFGAEVNGSNATYDSQTLTGSSTRYFFLYKANKTTGAITSSLLPVDDTAPTFIDVFGRNLQLSYVAICGNRVVWYYPSGASTTITVGSKTLINTTNQALIVTDLNMNPIGVYRLATNAGANPVCTADNTGVYLLAGSGTSQKAITNSDVISAPNGGVLQITLP